MEIAIINNIKEYLEIIHQTKFIDCNWFRGQQFSEYQLEPSLFRDKKEIITGDKYIQFRSYQFKDEENALKYFKIEYSKLNDTKDFDDIHYLYLMQHYDIPTRLLDFSTNPLIALFFSVQRTNKINKNNEDNYFKMQSDLYDYNRESSAVYCINPYVVNNYSINTKQIIDLSNYKYSSLKNIDFPICIKPRKENLNNRIKAPKGVFVFFGNKVHPLDYYSIQEKKMLKIIIPNSSRPKIKNELKKKFNIYHSSIFPDMKGVSEGTIDVLNRTFK